MATLSKVSLNLGSGGKASYRFISKEILSRFSNESLNKLADGANIENGLVVTTDTFTVYPPFFDGGNIGILAFCGMINDLASMAAEPLYMTMSLVIEEGFDYETVINVLDEIKLLSDRYNVKLVTGDTKIVEKGKMEGLHINITGIGKRYTDYFLPCDSYDVGDKILLTGAVGEHSVAVLKAKGTVSFDGVVNSDVAPLWDIVKALIDNGMSPKFIRDVTRGGLATVLNELALSGKMKIFVKEEAIPVNEKVKAVCDIYGFDIYSLACEGRMVMVFKENEAEKAVGILKQFGVSKDAALIGEVVEKDKPIVVLETDFGGKTVLDMPLGEILPRIC